MMRPRPKWVRRTRTRQPEWLGGTPFVVGVDGDAYRFIRCYDNEVIAILDEGDLISITPEEIVSRLRGDNVVQLFPDAA